MKDRKTNTAAEYGTAAVLAGLTIQLALDLRLFEGMTDASEKYRALADAFTIPGITLIMLWLLMLAAAEGIFDGLGYALTRTVSGLIPGSGGRKTESYAEYLERKTADRSGKRCGFLLYEGLVCTAAAVVFTALYYSV